MALGARLNHLHRAARVRGQVIPVQTVSELRACAGQGALATSVELRGSAGGLLSWLRQSVGTGTEINAQLAVVLG